MSLSESAAVPVNTAKSAGQGVAAALAAYLSWGFLPILIHQVQAVGSIMIAAERTVYSLLLLVIILAFTRSFGEVRAFLRDGRKVRVLFISAVLLGGNWLLYVWAIESGQVLQASLGYFINPLVNIAIGMVLLGERQNRWQQVAIGLAAVAIAIQAAGLGDVPYVALGLALTFGFYGYFRKTAMLGPATGLFAETMLIAPFALGYIAYNLATVGVGLHGDPQTMLLLMLTGPATAVPLLLFAFAVQRLRLTTIGMFQYVAPTIQFLIAVFLFQEELNPTMLLSFGLIWLSLVVFSIDSLRRRPAPAPARIPAI